MLESLAKLSNILAIINRFQHHQKYNFSLIRKISSAQTFSLIQRTLFHDMLNSKNTIPRYVELQKQSPGVLQKRPVTLLKKKLWHRCFPVNFAKFLRTHFLIEHLRRLLLELLITITIFFYRNHIFLCCFKNISSGP